MIRLNKILVLLLLMLFVKTISAQVNTVSAGGNGSSATGSISFSLGQIDYISTSSSEGSLNLGVQHPYLISVLISAENTNFIKLNLSTYPNPTTENITLSIDKFENQNLSYVLYDINSRVLCADIVRNAETAITMNQLNTATYFLKVTQNDIEIKTFRIIKN